MMDGLLENAQRYSDILKRCNLPEIANWKVEDIERAFHWAGYFKNVFPSEPPPKLILELPVNIQFVHERLPLSSTPVHLNI